MKKRCDTCAYFKKGWTEDVNDGWCKCDYDSHFDEWDGRTPDEVWCSGWKSEKKWGEITRLRGDIQELKWRMRQIAGSIEFGKVDNLAFALKIAKQYGGEA